MIKPILYDPSKRYFLCSWSTNISITFTFFAALILFLDWRYGRRVCYGHILEREDHIHVEDEKSRRRRIERGNILDWTGNLLKMYLVWKTTSVVILKKICVISKYRCIEHSMKITIKILNLFCYMSCITFLSITVQME